MSINNKESTLKIFFTRAVKKKLAKKGFYSNLKGKQIINYNIKIELPCDLSDLTLSDTLDVGSFTSFGKNTQRTSPLKIGKFCSVGSNVLIGAARHPTDRISTSSFFYQDDFMYGFAKNLINIHELQEFKPDERVIIGNDVWIGNNVVIMSGIKIGNGAIIGANSVVTKDVKVNEIVGGVPTKLIRIRKPIKNKAFFIQKTVFDRLINKNDFPFLVGKDFIKYKSMFRFLYKRIIL